MATKPIGQRPAAKPLAQRVGPSEEERQEEQQQRQPARSKADMFKETTPETGINVPVGSYVAHLVDMQFTQDDSSQKEYVEVSYEVTEGEQEGKTIKAWYNLFDKDGKPQRGMGFLKRDVSILGCPDELDYDSLQDQLDGIIADRPLCNLTVKENKGYINVFLQGLAEG